MTEERKGLVDSTRGPDAALRMKVALSSQLRQLGKTLVFLADRIESSEVEKNNDWKVQLNVTSGYNGINSLVEGPKGSDQKIVIPGFLVDALSPIIHTIQCYARYQAYHDLEEKYMHAARALISDHPAFLKGMQVHWNETIKLEHFEYKYNTPGHAPDYEKVRETDEIVTYFGTIEHIAHVSNSNTIAVLVKNIRRSTYICSDNVKINDLYKPDDVSLIEITKLHNIPIGPKEL